MGTMKGTNRPYATVFVTLLIRETRSWLLNLCSRVHRLMHMELVT